jgi:hypothetical protein
MRRTLELADASVVYLLIEEAIRISKSREASKPEHLLDEWHERRVADRV